MTIDWTKPVEHVDGTPLVAKRSVRNMMQINREDGAIFTPEQYPTYNIRNAYVWLDGRPNTESAAIVRNRATIDWTKPIEHVDGTPLLLKRNDLIGSKCIVREDGQPFAPGQYYPGSNGGYNHLWVGPRGGLDDEPVIVRNRAALDLTKPLEVVWTSDGVTTVSPVTLKTARDSHDHVAVTLEEGRTPWGKTIYFMPDGTPPRYYEKDATLRNRAADDGFQILRDMGYTCDDEGRWCPPAKIDEGAEFLNRVYALGLLPDTVARDATIDWLNRVLPAIRAGQDWREVA